MLNTRHKIQKTQNTCFSQASMQGSDQLSTALNDDLLTEIFLRLPVTSILRFKSVSKHWRWFLSRRHFTLQYDKLSKSPGIFLYDNYFPFDVENRNTPPPFRCHNFADDHNGIEIVQSCNGLLLCRSGEEAKHPIYYVFNPTTKQFAIIPSLPGGSRVSKSIRFMGLAFHPTDCVHYKVVCIRRIREIEPNGVWFQIRTYSSNIGRWKISIKSFSTYNYPVFNKGVYWNGAIHWAPSQDNHMYFKIDDEQLQSLPLPVEMSSSQTFTMYFGESRGHLHLILSSDRHRYNNLHLNVYELLSDHSVWFVKYQVELDELPGAFPQGYPPYDFHVIDVVRGEEEEDTLMVLNIPGKFITYNVQDKSFKLIFSQAIPYYWRSSSQFHRYTETLTSF